MSRRKNRRRQFHGERGRRPTMIDALDLPLPGHSIVDLTATWAKCKCGATITGADREDTERRAFAHTTGRDKAVV